MAQAQPTAVLLLTISLWLSASLPPRTLATAAEGSKPLITVVTQDAATSLFTAPLKDSRPLVLDLSGPLIWSTCDASHPTLDCHHADCAHAHSYHPPHCPHNGYGVADAEDRFRCKCTAHPYNPFTGEAASGDVTRTTISANATDGRNPLHPVSFSAVASCAPASLLAKLPAGAVGVAGLGISRVALPAQVARTQKVPNKFLLCLPKRGDAVHGVVDFGLAIFGGGPFNLPATGDRDLTDSLTYTPLVMKQGSPAYYIAAKGIAVNQAQVQLPEHALAVGGVVFSTRVPYTALRPDVYRPFVDAFDRAMGRNDAKVPAVAPFELCYNMSMLPNSRIGRLPPDVVLMLENGSNYTFVGTATLVDLFDILKSCFAFVEMKAEKGGYGGAPLPAVEIGAYQMGNNLLQFDLEKRQLGFASVPFFTSCDNFNLTMSQ